MNREEVPKQKVTKKKEEEKNIVPDIIGYFIVREGETALWKVDPSPHADLDIFIRQGVRRAAGADAYDVLDLDVPCDADQCLMSVNKISQQSCERFRHPFPLENYFRIEQHGDEFVAVLTHTVTAQGHRLATDDLMRFNKDSGNNIFHHLGVRHSSTRFSQS